MSDAVIVALISLCGNGVISLAGIFAANKLMQYRIEKLEEAVKENKNNTNKIFELDKHNSIQDEKIKNLEDETDRLIVDVKQLKGSAT